MSYMKILYNNFPKVAAALTVKGKLAEAQSAQRVAAAAAARAPVLTGALQGSVHAVGNQVSATAPYAGYVEYGTNDTPTQPFFWSQFDADAPRFVADLLAILKSGGG